MRKYREYKMKINGKKRNTATMLFLTGVLLLTGAGPSAFVMDAAGESQVADRSEMAQVEEVLDEGMTPVEGEALADGLYDIEVRSSSSMFSITACELMVLGGQMQAKMTMSGTGYLYVYPGTAHEAAEAPESEYITYEENEDGTHAFTIPVPALDAEVPCAAFSKRKEKWYDRSLAFISSSLPSDAFKESQFTTIELEDGTYMIDAKLQGGSGKASIGSPAVLEVEDGQAFLEVVFSSSHYDYMLVDGERYEPVNTEGNSTFKIPVQGYDWNMPVIADTTAMSRPHEIAYTIRLDSATIKPAGE